MLHKRFPSRASALSVTAGIAQTRTRLLQIFPRSSACVEVRSSGGDGLEPSRSRSFQAETKSLISAAPTRFSPTEVALEFHRHRAQGAPLWPLPSPAEPSRCEPGSSARGGRGGQGAGLRLSTESQRGPLGSRGKQFTTFLRSPQHSRAVADPDPGTWGPLARKS